MYSRPSGLRQTPPPIGTSGKVGLGSSSLRGRRSPSPVSDAGGSCGAVIIASLQCSIRGLEGLRALGAGYSEVGHSEV